MSEGGHAPCGAMPGLSFPGRDQGGEGLNRLELKFVIQLYMFSSSDGTSLAGSTSPAPGGGLYAPG